MRLAAIKRNAEFTPFAIETWCAVLSVFDPRIVRRAVLELAIGTDPFPDLGKVVEKCEVARRKAADLMPQVDGQLRIADSMMKSIADALEIEI